MTAPPGGDPAADSLCIRLNLLVSCRSCLAPSDTEVAMSLTEARFHDLVDATQQALDVVFEDSGLDVDVENSGGVLTVRFDNGSQLIFSRQPPLRQLWLAAKAGGFHFDYDEDNKQWMCEATDELLSEMLQRLVFDQTGEKLDFDDI
jgi:CyaY protein